MTPRLAAVGREKLAQGVRAAVGNPSERIQSLHDLAQRDLGVLVVHAKLKTVRLSAVTIAASPHVAIVLNTARENRPLLQRRSIAHELCHALFDPPTDGMLAVLDADLDGGDNDVIEQRARAFAAELLVPEAGLVDLLGVPESVDELDVATELATRAAEAFGAPTTLTANHLVNQRFVHPSLRENLVARVGRVVQRFKEVTTVSLETRVHRALTDGVISSGRAREILALSHHEALPFDLGS